MVDYKCSTHLNLVSTFSQTCPVWSICQCASTGRRAPWGWLLVISLCLTGLSLDQRETNVFRSASTSPQPCHRRSLVKRCFSANVTTIASFMSTSGLSHGLAVFRDPQADARRKNKKKRTKYLISPQPQTFHQKFYRIQMSETWAQSLFNGPLYPCLWVVRVKFEAAHADACGTALLIDALSFLLILIIFLWRGKPWSSKSFIDFAK